MIRPATSQDIPALLVLGERMHAESPRFCHLTFSRARTEQTLLNLIGNPNAFLWVAESEEQVYGGLAAIAVPHWASEDLIATDLALFIDPARRGSLSAVRLVNCYRCWASELGAKIIQMGVTTQVNTEETAQLLERLGMTRCGVILEA